MPYVRAAVTMAMVNAVNFGTTFTVLTNIATILALFGKGDVTVDYGEMRVRDLERCTIRNNGVEYTYDFKINKTVNGLWFGLIEYNCTDGNSGQLFSAPNCKSCSVHCTYDELIETCKSKIFPATVSWSVAMIPGLILGVLSNWLIKLAYHFIKSKLGLWRNSLMARIDKRISRVMTPKSIATEEEIDQMLINDLNSTLKAEGFNSNSNDANCGNSKTRNFKQSPKLKTTPIVVLVLFFVSLALGCDINLYTNSVNRLCMNNDCFDVPVLSLEIGTGQLICAVDNDGEKMEVSIMELNEVYRSELQYLTSNVSFIEEKSEWHCRGKGECQVDTCKDSTRHKDYRFIEGNLNVYGCKVKPAACGSYCYLSSVCVYYHLLVKPVGTRYPVFKTTGSIWEVTFKVIYKGISKQFTVNSNNPAFDLVDLTSKSKMKWPLQVTGVLKEDNIMDSHMILVDNLAVSVNANDKGYPTVNEVGDIQINFENESNFIYDTSSIHCSGSGCVPDCSYREPTIVRFMNQFQTYRVSSKARLTGDRRFLDSSFKTEGVVSVKIGNINIDHMSAIKPSCELKVITAISCKGCDFRSRAVIHSDNLKQSGQFRFISNCSFNTNILSCKENYYEIINTDGNKWCSINIPLLNQSVYITFTEISMTNLEPIKNIKFRESLTDSIMSAVSEEGFILNTMQNIVTLGVVTVAISMISRFIQVLLLQKTAKDINN